MRCRLGTFGAWSKVVLTVRIGYIDVVPIAGYLGVSNGASIYKNGPKENRRNSVALSMKLR
jgi:hypothetical protein